MLWLLVLWVVAVSAQCPDIGYGMHYYHDGHGNFTMVWINHNILYKQTINDTTSAPISIMPSASAFGIDEPESLYGYQDLHFVTSNHVDPWFDDLTAYAVIGDSSLPFRFDTPYEFGPNVQLSVGAWREITFNMIDIHSNFGVSIFCQDVIRCTPSRYNVSRPAAYDLYRFQATPIGYVLVKDPISGRTRLLNCSAPGGPDCVDQGLSIGLTGCVADAPDLLSQMNETLLVVGTSCGTVIQLTRPNGPNGPQGRWVHDRVLLNDVVKWGAITGVQARPEGIYFAGSKTDSIWLLPWNSVTPQVSMICAL